MNGSRKSGILLVFLRLYLGGLFAYSGFMKLAEPVENFRAALSQYSLIPYALTPYLAKAVPWAEWIGGIFLITGYLTRWSGLLISMMSLSFFSLIALSFLTGSVPPDCGCFGTAGVHLGMRQTLLLDWANVFFGLWLFHEKRHPVAVENLFD